MGAIWAKARVELRSSLRATVAMIVMIGLAGGVVLAAAAGARRTQTAFPRFLEASNAADLLISGGGPGLNGLSTLYPAIERLPEVERAGPIWGAPLGRITETGSLVEFPAQTNASVDGRFGYTIERPKLLEGRFPRPDRVGEVLVDRIASVRLHLSVGSRLHLAAALVPTGDGARLGPKDVTPVTLTVVGIGLFPESVLPITDQDAQSGILLTPAYYTAFAKPGVENYDGTVVRLRPGTDVGRFEAEVRELPAAQPYRTNGVLLFADQSEHLVAVQRAVFPEVLALWLFAALVAAGLLLVVGQIMARRVSVQSIEHPTLRALGMTRGQLIALAILRVGIQVVGGGVLAVVIAVLASPLMPFGPVRVVEPDPGVSVDAAILGVGFVALSVLLLMAVAVPAWRAASFRRGALGLAELPGAERPSRTAEAVARAGLPPSTAAGVRMALEPGRGRTAVPVRSGLVGLAVAIAAVAAAVTFGSSLTRLVTTPRLYGWNWDVQVDAQFTTVPPQQVQAMAARVPGVSAYSGGTYGDATIDGQQIPAIGIEPLKGSVFPTMIVGRPPATDAEIVLGAKDLRRIDRSVGDRVVVRIGDTTRTMRIVGQAVFPALGRGSFVPTGLGEGALVTAHAMPSVPSPSPGFNFVLLRYAPGTDAEASNAILRIALRRAGCPVAEHCVRVAQPPGDLTTYGRIRGTPLILAAVLAVLALAMMAHTLVMAVSRRRADLAILKTIGFVRRQLSAMVAWQATTLALLPMVVGLPAGIAAGRWAWSTFASQLGVPPSVTVPVVLLLLTVPVTLVLANLIAAFPARAAARTQPAVALRSE